MNSNQANRGVTLLQVLVVIAMVVVLMALLVPAVHVTLERAAITQCGIHLKSIAMGSTTYAVANQRHYPELPKFHAWIEGLGPVYRPDYLGAGGADDFRIKMRTLIPIEHYVCPLAPVEVSFDPADTGSSRAMASYALRTGWEFRTADGMVEQGMKRLGDTWTWRGARFTEIAGDLDWAYDDVDSDASHPDEAGVLVPTVKQNEEGLTTSYWGRSELQHRMRGVFDTHSAKSDGSVHLMHKVKFRDSRKTPVPFGSVEEPEPMNRVGGLYLPPG